MVHALSPLVVVVVVMVVVVWWYTDHQSDSSAHSCRLKLTYLRPCSTVSDGLLSQATYNPTTTCHLNNPPTIVVFCEFQENIYD